MAVRRLSSVITSDFSNLNLCLGNRCGSFDSQIVEEMGWSEKNVHEFKLRVKRIKKSIIDNGLLITERIVVGRLNGVDYIIDGQSRKEAIEQLNAEKQANGDTNLYSFEVATFEFDTKAEMITYMKTMNMCKKNWSSDNKTFAAIHAMEESEEKKQLIESNAIIQRLSNETGMCISVTKDVMFGQGSNKEERVKDCNVYGKQFWKGSYAFMNDILLLNRTIDANKHFDGNQKKLCTCEKFANGFRNLHYRIDKLGVTPIEKKRLHKQLTEKVCNYIGSITQATANTELKFATIGQATEKIRAIATKGMKRNSELVEALS